jgi:hypothetical protein
MLEGVEKVEERRWKWEGEGEEDEGMNAELSET